MSHELKAKLAELPDPSHYIKSSVAYKALTLLATYDKALDEAQQGAGKCELFTVRHYNADEYPTIKGNGFDGLTIGDTREEAEEFVSWINNAIQNNVHSASASGAQGSAAALSGWPSLPEGLITLTFGKLNPPPQQGRITGSLPFALCDECLKKATGEPAAAPQPGAVVDDSIDYQAIWKHATAIADAVAVIRAPASARAIVVENKPAEPEQKNPVHSASASVTTGSAAALSGEES